MLRYTHVFRAMAVLQWARYQRGPRRIREGQILLGKVKVLHNLDLLLDYRFEGQAIVNGVVNFDLQAQG